MLADVAPTSRICNDAAFQVAQALKVGQHGRQVAGDAGRMFDIERVA